MLRRAWRKIKQDREKGGGMGIFCFIKEYQGISLP